MFTRNTLRALANDNSYRRGAELYDDNAVEKLRRETDGFAAVVRGSQGYRVRLPATGPEFTCSCPYEFGGICKHAVATGLAVLDAYGRDLAAPPAAEAAAPPAGSELAAAVAAAWAGRRKSDKLCFLEQALTKSDDLARQFLAFGQPLVPANPHDPLAGLPERLRDTLETLEFGEDLWEEAGQRFGYDDEGDGLLELANERLTEALAPFAAELLHLARGGQLQVALRYWATTCAALGALPEPASDDYGVFGDYGQDVLRQWQADLAAAGWPAALTAAVLPAAEVKAALKWLGPQLAAPAPRWPGYDASWQPLLQVLATDAAAAPLLGTALQKAALEPAPLAHLRLRLAETARDDSAWVQAAETLLPTDAAVARQLLHYYTSQARATERLRVATAAFATWPDQFGDYVLTHFTPATAPALYPAALRHRALANASFSDYERLRPLLSDAEQEAFVRQAVAEARTRRGSIAFAADLLAARADVAGLRQLVLTLEWPHATPASALLHALKLLLQADPTALMLELEARTRAYLTGRAGARRGYALYQQLATWLSLAEQTAPRLREPVLRLAQELRAEFPTLHGLKEELQQRQLLPPPDPWAKKKKK